ncbi:hypothetical protein J5N97_014904 [Dioscorea zingiberensis]|uniref:Protein-tyrosine-phosphatase MKP1 n=1 Tax=Dioscorea zingiberensis TaxID=325984 RepID=A0A9D5CT77_9LILI|nr:hypothetical protein J5N97_014904 [Dioscorea zingiberensis]
MSGEEDAGAVSGCRRTYWRSASWSSSRASASGDGSEEISANKQLRRCPAPPLTPRSQNSKARSCLPPLQPLSIARRSFDEWPKAGSDDVGEWLQPPTPSGMAVGCSKPGESLKLDLPSLHAQGEKGLLASFDKECSKVADHIYLGGDSVARNREILKQNGITHVLNCVGFVCPEYFKSDLVYKTLWLQDSPTEDITSILYDVFDYFEDVREQGGRVFVHCCQGVSRSTSLVIAYLMWRKGQSFDDAFQFVKNARGIANPNMGFAVQLLQCQKRVLAIPLSPNSVLRLYRMAPHSPYDALHLVPKMLNEPSPKALDSRGAFILHFLSSIFVWIGKDCKPVMEKDAKAAAFQVVRYERVQGPIVTVCEGEEPAEFWEAFTSVPVAITSGDATKFGKEQIELVSKIAPGKRIVASYDVDFELFYKAMTGGVLPPFPSSGSGQETHLPARESNWSILRRKFVSGSMSRVYSDSVLVRDSDHRINRLQLLTTESSSSHSYLSPGPLSADYSSCSKSNSESPSMSPSTCSPTPSPASSNVPDSLLPPSKPFRFSSTLEPLKPSLESVQSPSKGLARSIAERRGSFSLMKLPALTKDEPLVSRKVTDASPALPNCPKDIMEYDCYRNCDGNALDSAASIGLGLDLKLSNEPSSSCSNYCLVPQGSSLHHDPSNNREILVYRWPKMEKMKTLSKEDLDSSAVFFLLTSDTARPGRMLYLWIGSSFEQSELQPQFNSGKDVKGADEIDWYRVGCDFLSFEHLPKDIPIKIVKEEEPEAFLKSLKSG